jgi:hypothetical protein
MYESSMDFWRGFHRNAIRLLAYDRGAAAWSVFTGFLPLAYVPILMWLWSDKEEDYVMLTFYGFAALPFLSLFPWYKNPMVLFTPLVAHLFPFIGINALARWLIGVKDSWKGRKI